MSWTSITSKALAIAETKGLEYNDPGLPRTRLRRLARELGVDRLELHQMEGDALVVERTRGQYTMFLNSGQAKSRHRFSTAHEVSHLLLSPLIGNRAIHRRRFSGQDDEGRRIEFLCDEMASAILMPRKRVETALDQTGQTARCIPRLVEDFDVSFEAAARRYVSLVDLSCVLVKWSTQAGVRKEERPITNFGLRGGWVKFQQPTPPSLSYSRDIRGMTVSEEDVTIYPGRYSKSAPVHVEKAPVETLRHGRGQYERMYSFIYPPQQAVKALRPSSRNRRSFR